MAKQTSLFGKISGKLGAVVFATSGGETISREYNPNVANPSTKAQVGQRARLKLMSQLSAALAPVIAMQKDGLVSARNQFVKKNFAASYASDGTAQITYENVQLTNGNAGLPAITATRAELSGITIQLSDDASSAVDRVVYIMYRKTSEQTLQLVQSIIVESAGGSGTFAGSMVYTEGDLVFYAYGMKDLNANAKAAYGNMAVANALDVARLVATRKVDASSYQFTQTRGATMYADEDEIAPVPDGYARVFLTTFGSGSVNGAGVFEIGSSVTIEATASEGYIFAGWRDNITQEVVSTDAQYTFTLQGQTDLVAFFSEALPESEYRLQVRPASTGASVGTQVKVGTQTGASVNVTVQAGNSVTIEALIGTAQDVTFAGWKWDGTNTYISTSDSYTFVPNRSGTLIAVWQQGGL